ncbi:o-succinylbenzoate synthase [soil metagenome]
MSGGPAPVEVELVRLQVPLRTALASAHGTEAVRDVILVRATRADGSTGWGECSALARPTYTHENTAGAWAVLRDELGPASLAGTDAGVVGHPMAGAALTTALTDAALRARKRSLTEHLAARHGAPASSVAVGTVVGRSDRPDVVLDAVADAVARGSALVKLKVTPRPTDLDTVAAVRERWVDLALAVDANGTLDWRSLAILDEMGLRYIEQPAPADALLVSAAMAERCATPIALDESVTSLATLETAMALGSAGVLNVKPARLGGLDVAADAARAAADAGWGVFVGGMLETGIGRASALAVAALPGCSLPTDLGPSSRYFTSDVTEPIELDDEARLPVPRGPGLGVVPLGDRLDELAIDRLVLRR